MRHYVTIEQATETPSAASGAPVAAWSTFVRRWVEIVTSGGREFNAAQSMYGELTHLLKIPHCFAAITSKMRVLMADGRTFEIVAAYSPDGRAPANAAEVYLACREAL